MYMCRSNVATVSQHTWLSYTMCNDAVSVWHVLQKLLFWWDGRAKKYIILCQGYRSSTLVTCVTDHHFILAAKTDVVEMLSYILCSLPTRPVLVTLKFWVLPSLLFTTILCNHFPTSRSPLLVESTDSMVLLLAILSTWCCVQCICLLLLPVE